jgi:hypothetical protein
MDINEIDESDALNYLDEIDKVNGVNNYTEELPTLKSVEREDTKIKNDNPNPTSLGKARGFDDISLSASEESPWKILNLETLPSTGMFYPARIEILIRSAKTKEIRHWSTMDEYDPVDIDEKINFILNSCTRIKIPGDPTQFTYNDILLIDRYHILFRIYELTFPNQENKLMANIKCQNDKCGFVNRVQVLSRNLKGFELPSDYFKWYNEEERCFVIHSEKLQETLKFYMPTIGLNTKIKYRKEFEINSGQERDPSFYDIAPYLILNWKIANNQNLGEFKINMESWSNAKFNAIYRFVKDMKDTSTNKVLCTCEKCKERTESSIFLGGSFTVKDIFIISARFDELI